MRRLLVRFDDDVATLIKVKGGSLAENNGVSMRLFYGCSKVSDLKEFRGWWLWRKS